MSITQRLRVGAEFCGWPHLTRIVEAGQNRRDMLLALTLFKTGGRVGEVLELTPANFDFSLSPYSVVVKGMRVTKKFRRVTPGVTELLDVRRTFPVIRTEPLSDVWVNMLTEQMTYTKFDRPLFAAWNPKQPMTRVNAWHVVTKMGKSADVQVSDHWFRGMRVSQLKEEYDYDRSSLEDLFGWSKDASSMPDRYGKVTWRWHERKMLLAKKMTDELSAYADKLAE